MGERGMSIESCIINPYVAQVFQELFRKQVGPCFSFGDVDAFRGTSANGDNTQIIFVVCRRVLSAEAKTISDGVLCGVDGSS